MNCLIVLLLDVCLRGFAVCWLVFVVRLCVVVLCCLGGVVVSLFPVFWAVDLVYGGSCLCALLFCSFVVWVVWIVQLLLGASCLCVVSSVDCVLIAAG